jgi:hypothetical protein
VKRRRRSSTSGVNTSRGRWWLPQSCLRRMPSLISKSRLPTSGVRPYNATTRRAALALSSGSQEQRSGTRLHPTQAGSIQPLRRRPHAQHGAAASSSGLSCGTLPATALSGGGVFVIAITYTGRRKQTGALPRCSSQGKLRLFNAPRESLVVHPHAPGPVTRAIRLSRAQLLSAVTARLAPLPHRVEVDGGLCCCVLEVDPLITLIDHARADLPAAEQRA